MDPDRAVALCVLRATSSTTSPVATPSRCALCGEIHTALSQVILFCGFGISCSHALLENAPSPTAGSGRKTISSPGAARRRCGSGIFAAGGVFSANAVPATTPSCSEICQKSSKSAPLCWALPVVLNRIVAGAVGLLVQNVQTSCAVLPSIHRLDQRLNDGSGAVLGPRIAPGLQIVRLRHVPVAPRRGFVVVQPEVRAQLHLLQRVQEIQSAGAS